MTERRRLERAAIGPRLLKPPPAIQKTPPCFWEVHVPEEGGGGARPRPSTGGTKARPADHASHFVSIRHSAWPSPDNGPAQGAFQDVRWPAARRSAGGEARPRRVMGGMNEAASRPLRSMVSTGWPKGAIRTGSIRSKMCDDRRHGVARMRRWLRETRPRLAGG